MINNLDKISAIISEKIGVPISFATCEQVGSGYHSDGFKLITEDGQAFFLKKIKSHDLGFEFTERQVSSLLVGHNMALRFDTSPKPLGIITMSGDKATLLPEISSETEIYHIQEMGTESVSYWTLLQEKAGKTAVDDKDIAELTEVIRIINTIHSQKKVVEDKNRLNTIYNDSLRSIIGHPELTLMLLNEFPDNHPLFPPEKHGSYVSKMIGLVRTWKDRGDRLTALHGDFWGANLFFRPDGSAWIIDFSRIPWGDPADDIAHWLSQYLWFYYATKNSYFKDLGEKFLDIYIRETGDQEIRKAMALKFGLMGLIFVCPRFYPNLNIEIATPFFATINKILNQGEFSWD